MLLLLLLFVVVRAPPRRCSRARQTRPQILTHLARARARARREPAHMLKEREPTNSAKTMVFTMFLQQAVKQKLKIRIANNKNTVFYDVLGLSGAKTRVQKSA